MVDFKSYEHKKSINLNISKYYYPHEIQRLSQYLTDC